jgi:hypothetical protein
VSDWKLKDTLLIIFNTQKKIQTFSCDKCMNCILYQLNNSVCVLLLTTFRAAFVSNLQTLLSLYFSARQGCRQDVQLSWLTSDPVVCHHNSRTCRKDSSAFNPNNEKIQRNYFRNRETRTHDWREYFCAKTIC